MARLHRFVDSDTGETTLDVVNNYQNKLSLQMMLLDIEEYFSLILSIEDEDKLFETLSERRLARLK